MRIEERIGAETATRQSTTSSAAEVQRTHSTPDGQGPPAGAFGDTARISGLTERIRDQLEAIGSQHEARIGRLTAEVRAGHYRVDVEALSRALAAEALGVAR